MLTSVSGMTHATQQLAGPARHVLWIDGVGGFLLCLAPRVTLGHANARPKPDLPLLADVSRLHAALQRDAEGYSLEAFRAAQVNGREAERATLRSGDRITLGPSCQFLFAQPLPVSASARLDLVSGHRLTYPVNSALLMADTLVLSGGTRGHVTVPGLPQPIIVFRQQETFALRYDGAIDVEGSARNGRAPLEPGRTVQIGDVSLSLERVS
ncbi:MAG: FHA domain-containing protein [Gemmataceae bacterium]|nr:FHA domain-containing protein [Gemmataceae bacterium]